MSKQFLGISFFAAGLILLLMDWMTAHAARMPVQLFCSGIFLGVGGIMLIWYISDHVAAKHLSPPPVNS